MLKGRLLLGVKVWVMLSMIVKANSRLVIGKVSWIDILRTNVPLINMVTFCGEFTRITYICGPLYQFSNWKTCKYFKNSKALWIAHHSCITLVWGYFEKIMNMQKPMQDVCLLRVFRPTQEFFTHHCRWRAAKFNLSSALKASKQWGFYRVPHLLWHGASVYNCHLGGPVTHT